jgi:hypothetical protein
MKLMHSYMHACIQRFFDSRAPERTALMRDAALPCAVNAQKLTQHPFARTHTCKNASIVLCPS